MRGLRSLCVIAFGLVCTALWMVGTSPATTAEDDPVFTIEFNDGKVSPLRIEVPAGRRFKLELRNNGSTPAEFESNELHKEKVLAPATTSILVFRTLDPGEYPFFDDFHPDAPKAVIVAK
jgi:Cupredoxin-like domain